MDCSLPGSSVHGILQARILEWVAISFSRSLQIMRRSPSTPALLPQGVAEASSLAPASAACPTPAPPFTSPRPSGGASCIRGNVRGVPGGVQGAPFPAAGLSLAVTLRPKPVSFFIRLASLVPLSECTEARAGAESPWRVPGWPLHNTLT